MGFGGISIWQLLIVLAIIVLLFGTKKLRSLGSDLGSAIKGFRNSVKDDGQADTPTPPPQLPEQNTHTNEAVKTQNTAATTDKDRN